jgi:hypothetical protein
LPESEQANADRRAERTIGILAMVIVGFVVLLVFAMAK